MTRHAAALGALTAAAFAAFAAPAAARGDCAAPLVPAGVAVLEETRPDPKGGPRHCRILARMNERIGQDGRPYALSFELRLPDDWNGRFVHQFNGGNDGAVKPAFAGLMSGLRADNALGRRYAVVSSDAGHDGKAVTDAGLAGGARFGFDAQARRDYGYGAVAALNPVAEAMVEAFYGRPIAYSYGIGGSNGGRHAMVAAARMPGAFDGLLIGYPGFNLPRAALQHALDVQAAHRVNPDIRAAFSPEDMGKVAGAVLAACDGLDGLEDGLVADLAGCQAAFDPDALLDAGLSAAQTGALKAMHAGPRGPNGEQLYSDWAWEPGIAGANWRFWKLESTVPPWEKMPIIAVMGAASLAQIFTTPPTAVGGTPAELQDYLLGFDIAAEAGKIDATAEGFPESAMEFMTPPGADDPVLAEFRKAGGRMLIFHGSADPVFSVLDTVRWYERLDANNDGAAAEFARFYPAPGMNHGPKGPTAEEYDLLTPLVNWVEKGRAPGPLVAKVGAGNEEAPKALRGAERLLCPWPAVARYKGGDPAAAASFACE